MRTIIIYLTHESIIKLHVTEVVDEEELRHLAYLEAPHTYLRRVFKHAFGRIQRPGKCHFLTASKSGVLNLTDGKFGYDGHAFDILPYDLFSLLDVLGCIDSAMHFYQLAMKKINTKTSILFIPSQPDPSDSDHALFLKSAMNGQRETEKETSNKLFLLVGRAMLQLVKRQVPFSEYHEMAGHIENLFLSPNPLRAILNRISPLPDMTDFINARTHDTVIQKILNPVVPVLEKDKALLSWLKTTIEKIELPRGIKDLPALCFKYLMRGLNNLDIFAEDETGARKKSEEPINKKVNREIDLFFQELNVLKKVTFERWLSRLYSEVADDGGHYGPSYTELKLLKESIFSLNDDGLMEIEFRGIGPRPDLFPQQSAYLEHYLPLDKARVMRLKEGEWSHKLEIELRAAAGKLGLTFLPNIDFHRDKVVFDAESTQILLPYGFHVHKEFAIKLLRAVHFARTALCTNQHSLFGMFNRDLHSKLISSSMGLDIQDANAVREVATSLMQKAKK